LGRQGNIGTAERGTFSEKVGFIAFLCDNLKILGRQVPPCRPWSYALEQQNHYVCKKRKKIASAAIFGLIFSKPPLLF